MVFTFMDFCAGIWWGRLWLEQAWLQCVWFSEIDAKAEKTYRLFFWNEEKNYWDLMKIKTDELPDFDLLIAWFPCQTFSVIWQRKWFEDPRGQVIYWISKILLEKKIKYFILENVKWLINHEWGKTVKEIVKLLDSIWYYVQWKVLNTIDYWLPQSRERVYFVWIRKDLGPISQKFVFPEKVEKKRNISDYLCETDDRYIMDFDKSKMETLDRYLKNKYNNWKISIHDLINRPWFVIDTRQSDIRFYDGFSPTLRTWRHGLLYSRSWSLRSLSGYESLLFQWFPKKFAEKAKNKILDKDLLAQTGNAMSVNTISAIWKYFLDFIKNNNPDGDTKRFSPNLISNSKTLIPEWVRCYN